MQRVPLEEIVYAVLKVAAADEARVRVVLYDVARERVPDATPVDARHVRALPLRDVVHVIVGHGHTSDGQRIRLARSGADPGASHVEDLAAGDVCARAASDARGDDAVRAVGMQ